MNEEKIISPSDEVRIVNAFKYWYETNTEKGVTSIPDYICKGLLDLYQKEKEKNKVYTELLKQNENRTKIKTCMTHNLPDNAEIICMIREDFERNFGNDYISKDKLSKLLEKRIKQYRKMGFNEAYSALVDLDEELLEERN